MTRICVLLTIPILPLSANAQVALTTWDTLSGDKTTTLYSHVDYEGALWLESSFTCAPPSKTLSIRSYPSALGDDEPQSMLRSGRTIDGCDSICKATNAAAFSEEQDAQTLEPKTMRLESAEWPKVRPELVSRLKNASHFHDLDEKQRKEAVIHNMGLLDRFEKKCKFK